MHISNNWHQPKFRVATERHCTAFPHKHMATPRCISPVINHLFISDFTCSQVSNAKLKAQHAKQGKAQDGNITTCMKQPSELSVLLTEKHSTAAVIANSLLHPLPKTNTGRYFCIYNSKNRAEQQVATLRCKQVQCCMKVHKKQRTNMSAW